MISEISSNQIKTTADFALPVFDHGSLETGWEFVSGLKPHPDNPRGFIDENALEIQQLAADLRERGIIEPLVVTPDKFILCGHRRHAGARIAGLEMVPVVYRTLRVGEHPEDFFLAENLQRQNLSPLEEARAIAKLKEKLECGISDVARRLNLPAPTVGARLAILKTPERVQQLFHKREIPLAAAPVLLKLEGWDAEIEKFADLLASRRINLRSLKPIVEKRANSLKFGNNAKNFNGANKNKNFRGEGVSQFAGNASGNSITITRQQALDALKQNGLKSIPLHVVAVLFEQQCCICGMMGNPEVCGTCPLPRIGLGISGRAS